MSDNTNDGHEFAGARLAKALFGQKGYDFVYGHRGNNDTDSPLELADDYSWLVAPLWLLTLNHRIEGFKITEPKAWQEAVRNKIETGAGGSLYELYQSLKGKV